MSTSSYDAELQQVEEHYAAQKAAGGPAGDELAAYCLSLCRLYPELEATGRAALRTSVSRHHQVRSRLFGWITGAADEIRTSDDVAWLDVGLAAAALDNCALDYRDWLLSVAFLYAAGEAAGIELHPHFQHYGALASWEQPRGGSTPVGEMLTNFHNYAVVGDGREFFRRWRRTHGDDSGRSGQLGR